MCPRISYGNGLPLLNIYVKIFVSIVFGATQKKKKKMRRRKNGTAHGKSYVCIYVNCGTSAKINNTIGFCVLNEPVLWLNSTDREREWALNRLTKNFRQRLENIPKAKMSRYTLENSRRSNRRKEIKTIFNIISITILALMFLLRITIYIGKMVAYTIPCWIICILILYMYMCVLQIR